MGKPWWEQAGLPAEVQKQYEADVWWNEPASVKLANIILFLPTLLAILLIPDRWLRWLYNKVMSYEKTYD